MEQKMYWVMDSRFNCISLTDIQPSCTRGEGTSLQNSSAIETQRAHFAFPIRPLGVKAFCGTTRLTVIEVGCKTEITKSTFSSYYACLI